MVKRISLIALVNLLLLSGMIELAAQALSLPFHYPQTAENVDYHSFSALMLKHRIGTDFQKLPKNPIVSASRAGWDSKDAADPFVLVTADSILLFYDGDNNDQYKIGYAVQDELGWGWKKRDKLLSGSGGEWDSFHQIAPVVFFRDGKWMIYYNGNVRDSELGYQWGMASGPSLNKLNYLPDLPFMALDTTHWDFAGNAYGDVLYFPEEKKFRLWYTGFQGPLASIGLAESSDGLRWNKVGEEPVLSSLPGIISPDIIFNGETYAMYFVQLELSDKSRMTKISRAESKDGIHWENAVEILQPDIRWEGKKLMRPNVSYFDGRVQLYYCAARGGRWRIGAAYTFAEFASPGKWASKLLEGRFQTVRIKYEQPAETSLQVNFLDPRSGKSFPADLEAQKKSLRKDVWLSALAFPQELQSREWQLELQLTTTNPNSSPVVYEIQLAP